MSVDLIREAKRRLRREVVEKVLAMDPSDRSRQEAALGQAFPTLPLLDTAATVLLYVSHLPEEFETRGMIRWSLERGKAVVCPRVDRPGRMLRLFRIEDPARDLAPGPFGIPEPTVGTTEIEPERIDWALVPGIAFDRRGFRLGRGAGYYDRLLSRMPASVPRLAMAFEPQWVDHVPTEPHDQSLDGIVSAGACWFARDPVRGPC